MAFVVNAAFREQLATMVVAAMGVFVTYDEEAGTGAKR